MTRELVLMFGLSLAACDSGSEPPLDTSGACSAYCEEVVRCGAAWAEERRGYEGCKWTYGEEEAFETCMSSCELDIADIEANEENSRSLERIEPCLECITSNFTDTCIDPVIAVESCSCAFDDIQLGWETVPITEPLTCDSGEHYPFASSDEDGEARRQRCLDGEEGQCR